MSISSVDSSPLHVKHETDLNVAAEANRILFVLNKLVQRSKFVVSVLNGFNHDSFFYETKPYLIIVSGSAGTHYQR